jgi:serine/threonine protein kinase
MSIQLGLPFLLTISFQSKGTFFAVKTIYRSPATDWRFARERSALRRFSGHGAKDSSHVVKLLATFEHRNAYSFIFPWADKNLSQYWQSEPEERHSGVTLRWLAEQCLGIAQALQVIHALNGHHGDIKPTNILWFSEDTKTGSCRSGGRLLVSNFALARFQSHNDRDKSKSTGPRSVFRTYSPPESNLTRGCISHPWDIWSLGCVWLEFVTWYLLGSEEALTEFTRARRRLGQFQDLQHDCFFAVQEQEGNGSLIQYNLNPAVRNVSNKPGYLPSIPSRLSRDVDVLPH